MDEDGDDTPDVVIQVAFTLTSQHHLLFQFFKYHFKARDLVNGIFHERRFDSFSHTASFSN